MKDRNLPCDHPQGISCDGVMERIFSWKLHLTGTKVQERYFNHALGGVVTDTEARRIAKERGLIEVGNEIPGKHLKPEVSDYSEI
jgi:hypothetical protein